MASTSNIRRNFKRAPLKVCAENLEKNSMLMEKLANWHATVEMAEPRTPQPNTRMNSASSAMLMLMGITQIKSA